MKSLVAEDHFASRFLMKALLKRYGPCDTASNGVEAVEAVRVALAAQDPYDLICLDIVMPEMDGLQALRAIRRVEIEAGVGEPGRRRPARIFMTTAAGEAEQVRAARLGGCDDFLVKPIGGPKLVEHLRQFKLVD